MDKNFPEDLKYSKEHEWCRVDGKIATIGITWHAQDALGDIVYCELPDAGDELSVDQTFGVVESVKAVSDLYAPVSGKVLEKNDGVIESPEGLNEDPYGDAWMLKVELSDPSEVERLMSKADYEAFLEKSAD